MRTRCLLILFAWLLLACTRATTPAVLPPGTSASTFAPGTATPAGPATPTSAPSATAVVGGAVPFPTSFAEGLTARLATPNPSPNCPDHYPWFFDNRAQECAATLLNTWAAFEPFEHGLMVWISEGGHTYVLLDDGSPFKPYREVLDPSAAPLPTPDPSLTPPPGLYQPALGFGKFWRGLVPGTDWVRPGLGWATAPETGYSAFWQCNTAADDGARCYLTGPRDEVLVLARGSAHYWAYWQQAVR